MIEVSLMPLVKKLEKLRVKSHVETYREDMGLDSFLGLTNWIRVDGVIIKESVYKCFGKKESERHRNSGSISNLRITIFLKEKDKRNVNVFLKPFPN